MKIVNGLPALETIDVKRNFLENIIRKAMGGGDVLGVDMDVRTLMILSVESGKMFNEWFEEQLAEAFRLGYEERCKIEEELDKL